MTNEAQQAKERCESVAPGWKVKMQCVLPKGHSGNHEDSCHCWWRNNSSPSVAGQPEAPESPLNIVLPSQEAIGQVMNDPASCISFIPSNSHHDAPSVAAEGETARVSRPLEICANCGHGVAIHEWEDETSSCCLFAHRLFAGVGEGQPCQCPGYKPITAAAQPPQAAQGEEIWVGDRDWIADRELNKSIRAAKTVKDMGLSESAPTPAREVTQEVELPQWDAQCKQEMEAVSSDDRHTIGRMYLAQLECRERQLLAALQQNAAQIKRAECAEVLLGTLRPKLEDCEKAFYAAESQVKALTEEVERYKAQLSAIQKMPEASFEEWWTGPDGYSEFPSAARQEPIARAGWNARGGGK